MSYLQTVKITGMLIPQPYPLADFSGGLTENFIQGGPSAYMAADNFILTVDKKLECRYGSDILPSPNYVLPSGNSRVGALINFDNQAAIMAQSGPYLYVLNSVWQPLTGPSGNPALAPGDATNTISFGVFQHQIYITNDSTQQLPTKVYQDASGVWQVRTAGLPALPANPNYSDEALLSACISVANELLTLLLAHVEDVGTIGTNLHLALDSTSKATLLAATAATDLASLITLCTALSSAYGTHITDAQFQGGYRTYHFKNYDIYIGGNWVYLPYFTQGQNISVQPACNSINLATGVPVDAPTAALFLDDLLSKYKYHALAPFTHDRNNVYSVIGTHLPVSTHINYSTAPVVTPNIAPMNTAVSAFITQFNDHIASGGATNYHVYADAISEITIPAPTDMDSLFIAIAHCRAQYWMHQQDSNQPFYYGHGTTTTSSATVSSFAIDTDNATLSFAQAGGPDSMTVRAYTAGIGSGQAYTTAVSSGSTSFTMGAPGATVAASGATYAANTLVLSFSNWHRSQESNQQAAQFPASTWAVSGVDLSSWAFIFSSLVAYFNYHDGSATHSGISPGPISTTSVQLYQMTAAVPTIAQYVYAFHFLDAYSLAQNTFEVVGPVTYVGPIETCTIAPTLQSQVQSYTTFTTTAVPTAPVQISNIPSLANSASSNYDVDSLQVALFRSTDSGSVYYNLTPDTALDTWGGIPNGQSTYTDSLGDNIATAPGALTLSQQPPIYTSGNVLNFDPAPQCVCMHILNGTAWYGGIWDTGQFFSNRIRQSVPSAPDSAPGSFYVDLDDIVVGISSAKNTLVVLCANSTFSLSGLFTSQGTGQITPTKLSDAVGCISLASIVQTESGVFFAGNDGFYYCDGYQILKLSSALNATYQAFTQTPQQRKRIYGAYDKWNKRIWWSVQPNPSDLDVSKSYILNLIFGVSAQAVFTTASNGSNYMPSSMLFYNNVQYRGDARGYVFQHLPIYQSDPLVDVSNTPTGWDTTYLPFNYTSCALDFGTAFNRKWVPRITLTAKNEGNFALQIRSINDNGKSDAILSPMFYNQNSFWGDPSFGKWGTSGIAWDQVKEPDMWRRFPARQMRCDFKQISITPEKVGLYRYEDFPAGSTASVVSTGGSDGTATIATPSGYSSIIWPGGCTGYVIAFQNDGYVQEYTITAVSTNVLTISLPSGTVPSLSGQSWVIRGINKTGKLSLTAINIHYALLGKAQDAYQGPASSGENT